MPTPGGYERVYSPSIAALPDGGTAVAYVWRNEDGNSETVIDVYDVFGRLESRLDGLSGSVNIRDVELFGLADSGFGLVQEWSSYHSTAPSRRSSPSWGRMAIRCAMTLTTSTIGPRAEAPL